MRREYDKLSLVEPAMVGTDMDYTVTPRCTEVQSSRTDESADSTNSPSTSYSLSGNRTRRLLLHRVGTLPLSYQGYRYISEIKTERADQSSIVLSECSRITETRQSFCQPFHFI